MLSEIHCALQRNCSFNNFGGIEMKTIMTFISCMCVYFTCYSVSAQQMSVGSDTTTIRFSLILFDFDGSALSPDHRRTIDIMFERLRGNEERALFTIRGYTDIIGTASRNVRLARERARAVEEYIRKIAPLASVTINAVQYGTTPYRNDLPEERFYSRTVEVEIKVPHQKKC